MANSIAILNKIARNLEERGVAGISRSGDDVVVENASNDLTISYVDAVVGLDCACPQAQTGIGGITDTASPFLGIGVGNPGSLLITGADCTCCDFSDFWDTNIVVETFLVVSGHANDVTVENGNASYSQRFRGTSDWLNLGS